MSGYNPAATCDKPEPDENWICINCGQAVIPPVVYTVHIPKDIKFKRLTTTEV